MKKQEAEAKKQALWNTNVDAVTLDVFDKETADTHKMIVYGESNVGKTRWWLKILSWYKKHDTDAKDLLFCVVYPDRATGITKLIKGMPEDYKKRVKLFPVGTYEELVSATGTAERLLNEHFKTTGRLGWLVVELIGEAWMMSQDYYTRQAYGEGLGDYFAEKQQITNAIKEDSTAYEVLKGWKDWTIIKYFHNYAWIERIKRFPFNILFTSEVKEEGNSDSMFSPIGYRPAGEKDNMHRVDEIIYLTRKGNKFRQRCMKLTGFTHVYPEQDITGKNGFSTHKEMIAKLIKAGYRESAFKEIEKEAGIEPPKKPSDEKATEEDDMDIEIEEETKKEKKSKPEKEEIDIDEDEDEDEDEKTIKTVSKGKNGKEVENKISKKELANDDDLDFDEEEIDGIDGDTEEEKPKKKEKKEEKPKKKVEKKEKKEEDEDEDEDDDIEEVEW